MTVKRIAWKGSTTTRSGRVNGVRVFKTDWALNSSERQTPHVLYFLCPGFKTTRWVFASNEELEAFAEKVWTQWITRVTADSAEAELVDPVKES